MKGRRFIQNCISGLYALSRTIFQTVQQKCLLVLNSSRIRAGLELAFDTYTTTSPRGGACCKLWVSSQSHMRLIVCMVFHSVFHLLAQVQVIRRCRFYVLLEISSCIPNVTHEDIKSCNVKLVSSFWLNCLPSIQSQGALFEFLL